MSVWPSRLWEGEQEVISEARAMREGGASLRTIVETLVAKGHSISHTAVARVLRERDIMGGKELNRARL